MTDIQLTESQQTAISALMRDEDAIPPPLHLARGAHLRNDAVERDRARRDPDGFWAEQAAGVDWIEPWTQVADIHPPDHAWFIGGKLNASANCLDRHVHGDRRNQAALIWIGEDGEEHTYTYARLYREVNRFANALRRLGVGKGDRVVVYMPLVPEGIITMLACARIGAIHSVVYAGMGTQALSSRIADSGARTT